MDKKENLTIHLANYNGFKQTAGKGRIVCTIESLLDCCPFVSGIDFRIFDNGSTDGSLEYLFALPFGRKIFRKRFEGEPKWLATTINNMWNLRVTLMDETTKKYLWNIENDSYFYNKGDFVDQALEVLEENQDISIIHLRRWTPMDAKDQPGVGRNINRVAEVRQTGSGKTFYVMDKRVEDLIWTPVKDDLSKEFSPDKEVGYGLCPVGVEEVGAVRVNEKCEFERLLNEHWCSYTSHGWIGRTKDLKFLVVRYNCLSEREMSRTFKKHFRAAKLAKDAFVAFGWRTRNTQYSDADVLRTFEWAKMNNHSSVLDYGSFKGNALESNLAPDKDKTN